MYCLPGKDVGGRYENSLDTAYMIFHSPLIGGLLAIDLLAINLFNAAGMRITGSLGAVFRSVLEAVRTLNVWLLDLALYYYFTKNRLGEAWSKEWSWLQACGFVILVSSALTYGKGNMRAAKAAAAAASEEAAAAEAPAAAEEGAASPLPDTPGAASTSASPATPGLPPAAVSGRSIPQHMALPPRPGDGASPRSTPRISSSHRVSSLMASSVTVGSPMVAGRHFAEHVSHT